MNNLTRELLESRHAVRQRLDTEGDSWKFDNLGLGEYNQYFRPYIGCSIQDLRNSVLRRKGKVRAVNIMGGTRVLRELKVDEGYAVRLTDQRDQKSAEEDRRENVRLITGDIMSRRTIDQIPGDLDIVLCMPGGAWEFLPISPEFFYFLGNALVKKMAVDGTALIQLPLSVNTWIGDYTKRLSRSGGLTLKYYDKDATETQAVLILHKTSPEAKLPMIING